MGSGWGGRGGGETRVCTRGVDWHAAVAHRSTPLRIGSRNDSAAHRFVKRCAAARGWAWRRWSRVHTRTAHRSRRIGHGAYVTARGCEAGATNGAPGNGAQEKKWFAWWLSRTLAPQILVIPGPGAFNTRSPLLPLNCSTAPSRESSREPPNPPAQPISIVRGGSHAPCEAIEKTAPTAAHPAALASVPSSDMPPLVPLGTGLRVVMRIGVVSSL
jgi:hypothetical protein